MNDLLALVLIEVQIFMRASKAAGAFETMDSDAIHALVERLGYAHK
jgi:hypothetical protein